MRKTRKTKVQNRVRLSFAQLKPYAQFVARFRSGLTFFDNGNHFVNVPDGYDKSFQNMLSFTAVFKLALGALDYKFALIVDIIGNYFHKPQRLGLAVRDGDHVYAERRGQIGGLEKHVEYGFGVAVLFDFDYGAYPAAVGLVRDVAYAHKHALLFLTKFEYAF